MAAMKNLIAIAVVALMLLLIAPASDFKAQDDAVLERLRKAYAAANDQVKDVKDWPQWFRDRLEGTDGTGEFRDWYMSVADVTDWDQVLHLLDDDTHNALSTALDPTRYPGERLPDRGRINAFLEASEPHAARLDPLLEFDNLIGVPHMQDDGPNLSLTFAMLHAVTMLVDRCKSHVWLDNHEAAWAEAERLGALLTRFRKPTSIVELSIVAASWERHMEVLVYACAASSPPPGIVETLPIEIPEPDFAHVIEFELLALVWMMSAIGEEGWLEELVEDEQQEVIDDEQDEESLKPTLAGMADDFESLVAMRLHYRDGAELPEDAGDKGYFKRLEGMRERHRHTRAAAARANLVLELRRAEVDGTALHDFKFDEDAWPGFKLEAVPEDEGGGVRVLTPDNDSFSTVHLRPLR
jgi:hypothetical protein